MLKYLLLYWGLKKEKGGCLSKTKLRFEIESK